MLPDISRPLKKLLPHLLKAKEDNLNEADTCTRIYEVFQQVLGYDPLEDISREVQIKEGRADFAIKIEGAVKFLVEAKSAGTALRQRHAGQAELYAAEGNIPWVLVTNGVAWHLYHLTFEQGIEYEPAFQADISTDEFDSVAANLSLLHRRAFAKQELEEFWNHKAALSPESIAGALFTEETLRLIRRTIRRKEGPLVDEEDLGRAIHDMFSIETREKIGPLKIRRKRKAKEKETAQATSTEGSSPPAEAKPPPNAQVAPSRVDSAATTSSEDKKG